MKYPLIAAALLAGCAVQPPIPASQPQIPMTITAQPPKHVDVPPDPLATLPPAVRQAIEGNKPRTLHNGITTLFPYSPDSQWTIYCQSLRVTEIRLNSDEHASKKGVDIGDSARWGIEVGEQSVMVKPLADSTDKNMTTNLVIHTDHRSYHLLLRLRASFMPAIAWYYPDEVKAAQAERLPARSRPGAAERYESAC